MKLNDAIDQFILSMGGVWSPRTVIFYKDRLPKLTAYLGNVELESITITQLREWRVSLTRVDSKWGGRSSHPRLEAGLSPFYVHQIVRSVKRMFSWLEEEGMIIRNPARRLEKPKLPKLAARGIAAEDREKMLDAAAGDPRARLIVLFLSDTACRVSGLANLLLDDIDLTGRRAIIREKGRGGWGKERPVFFTKRTAEALDEYLAARVDVPGVNNLLTGYKRGIGCGWGSFGVDGIRKTLNKLAYTSGVRAAHNPHSFRHAAIRAWLNNGMPIGEAALLAGHSSVNVTADFYGIVSEATLKKDHQKFTWLKDQR